jgi:hypothetical protein
MPVEIEFSKHALYKLDLLKKHGLLLTLATIENAVRFPDKTEKGYNNRMIAQKVLDTQHVLRVIYEIKSEKIYIITVYPGRRTRYEKN